MPLPPNQNGKKRINKKAYFLCKTQIGSSTQYGIKHRLQYLNPSNIFYHFVESFSFILWCTLILRQHAVVFWLELLCTNHNHHRLCHWNISLKYKSAPHMCYVTFEQPQASLSASSLRHMEQQACLGPDADDMSAWGPRLWIALLDCL